MGVFGGMFGAFMYVEPLLTRVTGFDESAVPWLLVLFGVGLFTGNLLGGHWADRALTRTLVVLTLALAVSLVAFTLLSGSMLGSAAMLLAMGFFGFATVPGLQMRVLAHASGAPTMASSANIAAFNVGNFLGVGSRASPSVPVSAGPRRCGSAPASPRSASSSCSPPPAPSVRAPRPPTGRRCGR